MTDTTKQEAATDRSVASIKALPFVRDPTPEEIAAGQKGRIFWTATPSGNWQVDCDQGADWARALLAHMAEHRDLFALGWVVRDMKAEAGMSGQAVGFLSVFAALARLATMIATGKAETRLAEAEAEKAKGVAA